MGVFGYLPPPVRCEPLAEMAARFGGSVTERGREPLVHAHSYALPSRAPEELMRYFSALQTVEPGPELIARLPGGRVYGSGIVLAPDGSSLARDVSPDFGSSPYGHWLQTYDRIRPPVRIEGAVAVIAVNLGSGYAHWLLEELPRLLVLAPEERRSLIAHGGASFIDDAFAFAFGESGNPLSSRVARVGRHTHFECEQLIVLGLVGRPGEPTPRVVELLSEFTAPLRRETGMTPSAHGERLYITREGAARRRVTNEGALWPKLEARGFQKLRLETLSWTEQINAFAQAREIVAPHGAGLANLVFCQPGTRVVEFFNRAYVNPYFWRLAALAGLDYRPVVSRAPADDDTPPTCTREAGRLDIEADIGEVIHALNAG